MNFDLTEDQIELRDSVRRVLANECSPQIARAHYETGTGPPQPWEKGIELGWPALILPEGLGGLGLGFVELGLLCEEHGYRLATGPLLSTLSQYAPILLEAASAEQKEKLLRPVGTGSLTGTLAIAGRDANFFEPDEEMTAVPAEVPAGFQNGSGNPDRHGNGWQLSGRRHYVLDAAGATEIAVAARVDRGDGVGLFVVPRAQFSVDSPSASLDGSRPVSTVHLDAIHVGADRTLGEPGKCAPLLARALQWSIVAIAFDMLGTCQQLFEITTEYAKQREQFGKPIGAFQATQHKLADAFIALEKARSTACFAAMTIAEDDVRRDLASSMAKAAIGDCQQIVAKEGIQIHGGLGFTWEQDIHLYVKRVKTGESLFGTTDQHRQRIARILLDE